MDSTNTSDNSIILSEEAGNVPYSKEVDYGAFSKVLGNSKTAESYTIYWLICLIEEVSSGKRIIDFRTMSCKMIVHAWYPILKYKLSFGFSNKIADAVLHASLLLDLSPDYEGNELFRVLYGSTDEELNKKINELASEVPYKFLSPFFRKEIRKEKEVQKIIEELSSNDTKCIYQIHVNDNANKYIVINSEWDAYFTNNFKFIKEYAYYKLICFLHKYNTYTPAIALKLEAPKERELKNVTKIWKRIIKEKHIKDLCTGLEYNEENFEKYGALCIDHFIPWSFVVHDQMWNLMPCFKNISISKKDKMLDYDTYIKKFVSIQYEAFCFVVDNKYKTEIEEYREALKIDDILKFRNECGSDGFENAFKKMIFPVYNLALNQGFEVMKL